VLLVGNQQTRSQFETERPNVLSECSNEEISSCEAQMIVQMFDPHNIRRPARALNITQAAEPLKVREATLPVGQS